MQIRAPIALAVQYTVRMENEEKSSKSPSSDKADRNLALIYVQLQENYFKEKAIK